MRRINFKNILIGAAGGFVLGFIILHPFSMLFQGMIFPVFNLDFGIFMDAFNPYHFPMAIFFGLLGSLTCTLIIFLFSALSQEREKVKILEGLLPICSWCKKIRDDEGKESGTGDWIEIEEYIRQRSDTEFTHGMCQKCYSEVMKDYREKWKTEESRGK